jgi:hypothetical protein
MNPLTIVGQSVRLTIKGENVYNEELVRDALKGKVKDCYIDLFLGAAKREEWTDSFLYSQVLHFVVGHRDDRLHDITCLWLRPIQDGTLRLQVDGVLEMLDGKSDTNGKKVEKKFLLSYLRFLAEELKKRI